MYRPFMAVESQVQQLNRRGLQTDMRTPWILEREGYYSVVNGYKDPFLDKEAGKRTHEDRYLTGTSFNDLYALFVFDRNLRFLLFRMTTLSEAILKTICSYEFTKENAEEKNPYLAMELKLFCRDMKNEMLEPALDKFGKRCGSALYLKFCALLIQNVKKGTKDFLPMLREEAASAFLLQKQQQPLASS